MLVDGRVWHFTDPTESQELFGTQIDPGKARREVNRKGEVSSGRLIHAWSLFNFLLRDGVKGGDRNSEHICLDPNPTGVHRNFQWALNQILY